MADKTLAEYKIQALEDDDFQVEYEILPSFDECTDPRKAHIAAQIADIDARNAEIQNKIDALNTEIDRLTNHADGLDYTIAVASGVLCGMIDSLVIGEFSFERGKAVSHRQMNDFITKFAKLNGYEGERLAGAISRLEEKFPVAQDNIWKGANIGVSAKNHHLADFAHHPTLLGLVASIVVQLFRTGIFVDRNGEWHFVLVKTESEELIRIWLPIIISGLLLWMCNIAESKYKDKIDEKIPKPIQKLIKLLAAAPAVISVLKVAGNWAGHLVSDMGGSKNTAGGGMGIPGLFVSLLHELSSLPLLKDTGLPKIVNDLYVKEKFDMRSELAVLNELGRQAIPVLLGEVLVRSFYFVRRLVCEYKEHGNFKDVNWNAVIPFKNRTIARMMTIESGTFTAIDLADAAIRSAIKNGPPTNPLFWKDFILRVNFVGVGRFVIAVATDVGMGIKRQKAINDKLKLRSQSLMLQIAKIFYLQEGMWIEAEATEQAMEQLYVVAEKSAEYFVASCEVISGSIEHIGDTVPEVERNNPGLIDEMKDILQWG
ncbi:MAG: hypothetical protein J1E32_01430 [Treponema sp.]|nr:hypothetical protein [Treponema sp.]